MQSLPDTLLVLDCLRQAEQERPQEYWMTENSAEKKTIERRDKPSRFVISETFKISESSANKHIKSLRYKLKVIELDPNRTFVGVRPPSTESTEKSPRPTQQAVFRVNKRGLDFLNLFTEYLEEIKVSRRKKKV